MASDSAAATVIPTDGPPPYESCITTQPEQDDDELEIKLHPDWINIEDLKLWIHTCTTEHGEKCSPPSSMTLPLDARPEWLIDVESNCVVPADASHRYLALSYVWGQVPSTELKTENLETLRQPGALSWHNLDVVVPKTIRHSMGLLRGLGERYLWVDRFCILQDDFKSKHAQLERMGAIYANAHVTIVAANGWDADHGLRGLQGITDPRHIRPNFEYDYRESLQLSSSYWNDRGWTFQELFFSRRKLFFAYQVAVWECSCGVWHESTGTTGDVPVSNYGAKAVKNPAQKPPRIYWGRMKSLTSSGSADIFQKPDLSEYFDLVIRYNSRKLTFPEDGYNAFLGVVSCLQGTYPGGFIWGLPRMALEECLLWTPFQIMKRRRPRLASSEPLPSWSWVGWEGICYARRCEVDGIYPSPPPVADFEPTCKWQWPADEVLLKEARAEAGLRPSRGGVPEGLGPDDSHILQITAETAMINLEETLYWMDGWAMNEAGRLGPEENGGQGRRAEVLLVAGSTQPPSEYRFTDRHTADFGGNVEEWNARLERFPEVWDWCNLLVIERNKGEGTRSRIGVALIPKVDWEKLTRKNETVFLA